MTRNTIAGVLSGALVLSACGGDKPAEPPPTTVAAAPAGTWPAPGGEAVPAVAGQRNVVYNFETAQADGPDVAVQGWAFLDVDPAKKAKPDARNSEIFLVLTPDAGPSAMYRTTKVPRPDISKVYGPNLDESGFAASVPRAAFPKGTYRLGVYVRRPGEEAVATSDKMVEVR